MVSASLLLLAAPLSFISCRIYRDPHLISGIHASAHQLKSLLNLSEREGDGQLPVVNVKAELLLCQSLGWWQKGDCKIRGFPIWGMASLILGIGGGEEIS